MNNLESLAQQLEQSNQYQVLKKLVPPSQYQPNNGQPLHKICIIDTETTGLDTSQCEIIELGYQIIEFDSEGFFYKVISAKNFLQEPNGEISAEVTQVTGLTLEDVKGQSIPWQEVAEDMADVKLCIAHNAGFDRPILERFNQVFVDKVWGCSVTQIDWFNLAKIASRSQEFLCWKVGKFFYNAHRALDDVQALTHLLQQPIGQPGLPALNFLLQAVRLQKVLIKATRAPFELKDQLKSRGYRWNAKAKVWLKTLDANLQKDELAWLIDNNTPNPTIIKLKANDNFSIRAN